MNVLDTFLFQNFADFGLHTLWKCKHVGSNSLSMQLKFRSANFLCSVKYNTSV